MDSEKMTTPTEEDGQEKAKGFDLKKIDILTAKDIQKMPEDEFLDMLKSSFEKTKDVIIKKVPMHELAQSMAKPRFDKIQKYIRYGKDQKEHFEITVPFINEKLLEVNKRDNGSFKVELQEYQSFPDTDCFIRCDSRPIQNSLGLLTIENKGYVVPRKFNDHKHDDTRLHYSKESFFYFDYQKEKYIQAFTDDVLDLRRLDKLGKEIDECKYESHALIFWKREKLLDEIEDRLKEISERRCYRQKFNIFLNTKRPTPCSADDLKKYAKKYQEFLLELYDWLQIKLYLGKISPFVYEALKEETGDLEIICINIRAEAGYTKDDVDKLDKFREGKPEDDKLQPHNLMQGFIKYDSEKRILVPTIVEVERSRSIRLTDHYNDIKYEEYLERVMRLLDKKEAQKQS